MQDPFGVAKCKSFQGHLKVRFSVSGREEYVPVTNDSFEVGLHELEDKMQVSFVWKSLGQLYDVGMFEFFKQFNFPKCCDVDSFLLLPKPNFLDGHSLSCL